MDSVISMLPGARDFCSLVLCQLSHGRYHEGLDSILRALSLRGSMDRLDPFFDVYKRFEHALRNENCRLRWQRERDVKYALSGLSQIAGPRKQIF